MASYETLRRKVRHLETTLEPQLTSYSKLAAQVGTSYASHGSLSGSSSNEGGKSSKVAEDEIETGLAELGNLVDELSKLIESPSAPAPPTATQRHAIQRHQEVLEEYTRDFRRTKASKKAAEDRARLLESVRGEISAFNSASGSSAKDQLLAERSRLDSSHQMADDVLGQAYETRYQFSQQRSAIQGINTRMGGVISTIPGINSVMGMINSRRRRDSYILGSVISLCTLFLLWWITG